MTVIKNIAKDRVLQITAVIAVLSLFIARPRLADINFDTLWSILAMMTIIQVFEYLHILDYLAYRLTSHASNTRQLTSLFVTLALFAGMFLTNDVTVITLVPLYLNIAKKYKLPEILPVTLIGMAANFGSAFTPFGNTHNIFLMNHFHIPLLDFFKLSVPLLIASVILLIGFVAFVRKAPVPTVPVQDIRIMARPTIITGGVALVIFSGVMGWLPSWIGAVAAIVLALGFNPKILTEVDYAIVLTFGGFFVITSVLRQVPWISRVIAQLMASEHSVYLTSIISSQFISNVPSTVLIGIFTNMVAALFLGSNIGGLGSVVGSMCNLLVFKEYTDYGNHQPAKFFWGFTAFNFVGLFILGALGWVILEIVA